jgi:hypothetical protein
VGSAIIFLSVPHDRSVDHLLLACPAVLTNQVQAMRYAVLVLYRPIYRERLLFLTTIVKQQVASIDLPDRRVLPGISEPVQFVQWH